jgi:prevent-host-death family protein
MSGLQEVSGGHGGHDSAFRFRSLAPPDLTNEPDQTRFEVMKILNVQEAKTHLSRLMEDAAAGEEILLAKHGKPMVRLSAYRPESEPRKLGGYEKQIRVAEDFDEEDPRILALFHAS